MAGDFLRAAEIFRVAHTIIDRLVIAADHQSGDAGDASQTLVSAKMGGRRPASGGVTRLPGLTTDSLSGRPVTAAPARLARVDTEIASESEWQRPKDD